MLAALEAELTPAFSDMCRIESFDRPEEVLAGLPGWAAERRAIAVVVIDQKMPGMTGVELVIRLREASREVPAAFGPAAHAGVILLTGYAGLDSAIAAKNEAGVDRYLEKPWSLPALIDEVALLVRRFLRRSALGDYVLFREAETVEEAQVLLTRRWEIARLGPTGMFALGTLGHGELDPYDLRSHHLGVFLHDAVEPTVVGMVRVSVSYTTPHWERNPKWANTRRVR